MWRLARDCGTLDLNTPYAYLVLAREMAETCRIAELDGAPVGFVLAFPPPQRPGHLFVWQIGVAPSVRGRGVAGAMLDDLADAGAVDVLEATVTESNLASRALFDGVARRHGTTATWRELIRAEDFPEAGPEAEPMVQIPVASVE